MESYIKQLEELITVDEAFLMLHNAIENHAIVSFVDCHRAMYSDIRNHYFNGNDSLMKDAWLKYQIDFYKDEKQ